MVRLIGALGRLRRWLVNTAVFLASIAVCLLAIEAGLRLANGIPLLSSSNFIGVRLDIIRKTSGVGVDYDSRVGWVQAPNVKWSDEKYIEEFTTGAYGARMPSNEIVPLQQNAILAVGDSFLVGSEVTDRGAWPAQLERMIGTQIINLGVGGFGLDQSVLRAEDLLPALKPRMLFVETRFEFGVLNLGRMSVYGGAPKPYFTVRDGKLVLENDPVPRLAASRSDIGMLRAVLGHSYLVDFTMARLNKLQWWVGTAGTYNKISTSAQEVLDATCLLMKRLGDVAAKSNTRSILILQYSGPEGLNEKVPWHGDIERISGCAQQAGVEVVDLFDGLRTVYVDRGLEAFQKLWVMTDNNRAYGHMSVEGNALVAKLVAQKLFPNSAADQKSK